MSSLQVFAEVLIAGLLTGIMYSLVALGFVLIYKASSVFNFAQGAMVFFAALTLVGIIELGVPFWLALLLTIGVMVLLGMGIEKFVLRPLVNQHEITLLMATIGLTFAAEFLHPPLLVWGNAFGARAALHAAQQAKDAIRYTVEWLDAFLTERDPGPQYSFAGRENGVVSTSSASH